MAGDVEDFRANDADGDGIDDAPAPGLRDRFDRLPAPLRCIGWLFGWPFLLASSFNRRSGLPRPVSVATWAVLGFVGVTWVVTLAMVPFVDGTTSSGPVTIADPSQHGAGADADPDLTIEPTAEATSSPSEASTPDELEPSPSVGTGATTATPSPTDEPTKEPSPAGTSTPTPRGDSAPVIRSSVVTNIVDGDTVDIGDGTRVRLAIVNTPETHGGRERCGSEASTFASDFIRGEAVDIYRPEGAPVADSYGRLLGEVVRRSDGASLNVALAAAGLGTVDERFTDEDPDLARRARAAQASAGEPNCEPVAQPSPYSY